MPVAFDAASSAITTLASSLTFSHTVTGSNLALGVGVEFGDTGLVRTVSSITYNAVNLTKPAGGTSYNGTSIRSELWYLANPASGANNVVITLSASVDGELIGGAVSMTGVDQATPVGTAANATGQSTTPTVTVTSAVDEMVMDSVAYNLTTGATPGAGQTERWERLASLTNSGVGSTEAGAASVVMDWTTLLSDWATVGLPFNEAVDTLFAQSVL